MTAYSRFYNTRHNDSIFQSPLFTATTDVGGWNAGTYPNSGGHSTVWPWKIGDGAQVDYNPVPQISTASLPYKAFRRRFSTPPLKAQTIAGTVTFVLGLFRSAADAMFYTRVVVWVGVGITSQVRGMLATYDESSGGGATVWPTTFTARGPQTSIALTSTDIVEGDCIHIELGVNSEATYAGSRSAQIRLGSMSNAPLNGGSALADMTLGSTNMSTAGYFDFSPALEVMDPPPNDNCANPTIVTELPFNESQSTVWANYEAGVDVVPGCGVANDQCYYHTVWYAFTPPETKRYRFIVFDSWLTIYTGTCGSLVEVACANPLFGQEFTVPLTSGVQYRIRLARRFQGGANIEQFLLRNSSQVPSFRWSAVQFIEPQRQ